MCAGISRKFTCLIEVFVQNEFSNVDFFVIMQVIVSLVTMSLLNETFGTRFSCVFHTGVVETLCHGYAIL